MDVKEALKIVLMLLLNNQPGPSHSDRTNSRSMALSLDTEVRSMVYFYKQSLTHLVPCRRKYLALSKDGYGEVKRVFFMRKLIMSMLSYVPFALKHL